MWELCAGNAQSGIGRTRTADGIVGILNLTPFLPFVLTVLSGVVLVDPPLRLVMTSGIADYAGSRPAYTSKQTKPVSARLFQKGYPDFVPHSVQMETCSGPPRISMLQD